MKLLPRFREPAVGAATTEYVRVSPGRSGSVASSDAVPIPTEPPSATPAPALTARTGLSFVGVIVMAKTLLPTVPPLPSLTVKVNPSLVTSLPSWV